MADQLEFMSKSKKIKIDKSIKKIIKEELDYGINNFDTYKKFGEKVYNIRKNVLKNLDILKKK